jgi:hypothetical protein
LQAGGKEKPRLAQGRDLEEVSHEDSLFTIIYAAEKHAGSKIFWPFIMPFIIVQPVPHYTIPR